MRRARTSVVTLCVLLAGTPAGAQAISGFGGDAVLVPRGVVRLGVGSVWQRSDSRFTATGNVEPLAASLSDTLGTERVPALAPVETALRTLADVPELRVSLGAARTGIDESAVAVPLIAELGLARRVTLGVTVPIVRTRAEVFTNIVPGSATLGLNPARQVDTPGGLAARDTNHQLIEELSDALSQLGDLIEQCAQPGNPDPRCPTVNGSEGQALLQSAAQFESALIQVYGGAGAAFVPVAGGTIQAGIRGRLAALRQRFESLDIQSITIAGPIGAAGALGLDDLRRALIDTLFGYEAFPLQSVERTAVGDIEVAATLQLVNSLGFGRWRATGRGVRAAVTGVARLGTGSGDHADHFADVATGDGQTDVEVRSFLDLVLATRFWMSVGGRYTWQLGDRAEVRIAPPGVRLVPAYARQDVDRDLGDEWQLEATPRLVLGRYFSLGAQYLRRERAADRYTGTFDVEGETGQPLTLDASVLNDRGTQREERVSVGVMYSSVAAYEQRRSALPLDVIFWTGRSVRGSGRAPKLLMSALEVRVYMRIFGR